MQQSLSDSIMSNKQITKEKYVQQRSKMETNILAQLHPHLV